MRVTIEEAKTKWCPFARQLDNAYSNDERLQIYGGTANRDYVGNPKETCLCIADRCMAFKPMTLSKDLESPLAGLYYCGAFGIG